MPRFRIQLLLLAAIVLLIGVLTLPFANTQVQAETAVTPTLIAKEWNFLPVIHGFSLGPTMTPAPPNPTVTASPTLTSTPISTATPTATSTPTVTPTSTPTETPDPIPYIKKFKAVPDTILSGQETTLYWEVTGVYDSITINQGVGDVTNKKEITVKPDETTEYKLTVLYGEDEKLVRKTTVTIGKVGKEMLIYDWNGEVPQSSRGFPYYQPPTENGDWTQPTNFADGTLYFYVKIRSMPEPQEMKLQYCVWQDGTSNREQCANKGSLTGNPGTVITWLDTVQGMWSKPGAPKIDWSRPRFRDSAVVRNSRDEPVSPYTDPAWGGDDPKDWYPINWHFMAVVVEEGKAFSGWENYLP